jgi:isopenicillin-N epimerase
MPATSFEPRGRDRTPSGTLSRRRFAQILAGSAVAGLARPGWRADAAAVHDERPQHAPSSERSWERIRDAFVMPRELACLNAANLCPSPRVVLDRLEQATRAVDRDPSPQNRRQLAEGKEETRAIVAAFVGAAPEEIVLTRNTSEGNNLVSSGLDLGAGDEVVIFSDNHPSNHRAWTEKAARHGFTVKVVPHVNPHPGADHYIEAFLKASTPRTKLWALTHVTNSVGDLLPVAELCRAARGRGILTLVDGAQTLGVLELDLPAMGCDFFTASGHKWPCGPRETGVLFVRRDAQDRLHPSVISLYAGATGASRTLEAYGQRDEAAILAFGEAIRFQMQVGRAAIERRARELAQALMAGLQRIDGVTLWTPRDPARSAAIVSCQVAGLDPRALADALYERDRIVCAARTGTDRPGLRFSPHFYNLMGEVDRTVAAVAHYVRRGL